MYNKYKTVETIVGRGGNEGNCFVFRYSEIVSLFQPPAIFSVRHCWFVTSCTHVRTTNAKRFKPVSEGVVMKERARKISVLVQSDSAAIPPSNYS